MRQQQNDRSAVRYHPKCGYSNKDVTALQMLCNKLGILLLHRLWQQPTQAEVALSPGNAQPQLSCSFVHTWCSQVVDACTRCRATWIVDSRLHLLVIIYGQHKILVLSASKRLGHVEKLCWYDVPIVVISQTRSLKY